MEFPAKESIGALVALSVAGLGYRQWKRTKRSGKFIEDRETAYKEVWEALEHVHLYVRAGQFDERAFDDLIRSANTLLIQRGLHISQGDKQRAASYIEALGRLGRVLAQMNPASGARREMALTAEGVAMPPEFKGAYDAYQSARESTMEGFRHAIGAGQI